MAENAGGVGRMGVADARAHRRDGDAGDATRVQGRQARQAGLVDTDARIVVERSEDIDLDRGLGPATEQPAVRAGEDHGADVLRRDERDGIDQHQRTLVTRLRQHVARLRGQRTRLDGRQRRGAEDFRCLARRHARPHAEHRSHRVGMRHHAAHGAVGPVADARRAVVDHGAGRAEAVAVGEPADARVVEADTGVVEQHADDAAGQRHVRCDHATVRGRDGDRAARLGAELRDRIENEDVGQEHGAAQPCGCALLWPSPSPR
ncbi:MAG: hypothetical protein EOP79_06400 [Variovorax sp.]|nr:MAG: hypothetical protein EOP79_06400 [Variovorax sp.]